MNAAFAQGLIEVETVGERVGQYCTKRIVDIPRKQVLQAGNEDVTFLSRHNGRGAACHQINSKPFEIIEAVTVLPVTCSGKEEVYRNGQESFRLRTAVRFVQVYSGKTASTMKHGTFMMCPEHNVLLIISVEVIQIVIYNRHTFIEFLFVEC